MLKKVAIGFFFLAAVVASSWALAHSGMFRVHDYVHAARIGEMLRGLKDGQFPVRWSENFGFGYGMPLFEFYAPLPYFIGAIFYWLGLDVVLTVKLLYLICTIGTFWGMYLLGAKLYGRSGGVLAAVALTVAPYRAVNLFVRGAVSEAWGIMAIPWVLLGIVQVVRREKGGWIKLIFGLITLFLSHNITTLLFIPVSVVFGMGYFLIWNFKHRVKDLRKFVIPGLQITAVYILGIGLCAFYIFPALAEKDFTKVNGIFQGYFNYHNHFLYIREFFEDRWGYGGSAPWPYNGISFFLGYGQWFGVAAATAGIAVTLFQKFKKGFLKSFQLQLFILNSGIFFFSLFMTTAKSQFIWDHLSFMVAVQFPWRWYSVTAVFMALLTAGVVVLIKNVRVRYAYVAILSIVLIVTNIRYFQPETFKDYTQAFYYTDVYRIRHDMSRTLNDYIPVQMQEGITQEIPPVDVPYKVVPVFEENRLKVSEKDAKLLMDKSQEKLVQTNFIQRADVEFSVADFPGWKMYLDGMEIPKGEDKLGNLMTTVPAGQHTIGVFLDSTPVRHWSDMASAASLVILLFLLVSVKIPRKMYGDPKSNRN